MENEAQCDDLDPRLEAKDPDEIRLRVILRRSTGQCSPPSPQQKATQQSLSDGHTDYPTANPARHLRLLQCALLAPTSLSVTT